MREIRPSGSEGGVAPTRHPYPYQLHRSGLAGDQSELFLDPSENRTLVESGPNFD